MLKTTNSVINVSQITGVLPVINGGTGVTTSTGTGDTVLSAAPTLSGNVTLSTGNLIPSTAGKGVDFSANTSAAGMTSELLNWYEEGTWTPVVIGTTTAGSGTYGTQVGTYTRIGRAVSFTLTLAWSAHTGTGSMYISGLPFTSRATGSYAFAIACYNLTFVGQLSCYMTASSANIFPLSIATASPYALLALDTAVTELEISGTYFV